MRKQFHKMAQEFKHHKTKQDRRSSNLSSGFSLIELLVTVVISSFIVLSASTLYFDSVKNYHDRRVRSEADELAKTVLDFMANDIRMMGNGFPNNNGWHMGSSPAAGFAYPMDYTTATSTTLHIGFSVDGKHTAISADVTPNAGVWVASVLDGSMFDTGSFAYIDGTAVGQEYGLIGLILSVSGNSLTFFVSSIYTTGASFTNGALIYKWKTEIFNSPNDWSGVTVQDEVGTSVLAPNSTFALSYLDSAGVAVTMNDANTRNSLAYIDATVYVRGRTTLKDGSTYTAWAREKIKPRFLHLFRQQEFSPTY